MNISKGIKQLERRVNPNTFMTLTMRQGIQNDVGTFIAGSEYVYNRVMVGLYKAIYILKYMVKGHGVENDVICQI